MDFATVRGKFPGALLGVAAGDALGAPFEGWPTVPSEAVVQRLEAGGPPRYTAAAASGGGNTPWGSWRTRRDTSWWR